MEGSNAESKSTTPKGLSIARSYRLQRSLLPDAVDEFSLYRVTSCLASILIAHRTLFCARVIKLPERNEYHSIWR